MKLREKEKAICLRKKGYSINEIHRKIKVAKSSVSVWVRNVDLSEKAKNRIISKSTKGQLKAKETHHRQTREKEKRAQNYAKKIISGITLNKKLECILCALVYWCEGNKNIDDLVFFTNSDPNLMSTFLHLLRRSFDLDEKKFRVCMHLHTYHNERRQKIFWSNITKIPQKQFIKSHQKKNTGKRTRDGYQGCIQVRYYDVIVARKLLHVAKEFMNKNGSVV